MKTMPTVRGPGLMRKDRYCRIVVALSVSFFIAPVLGDDLAQHKDQDEIVIETRLKETVEYLASDELQGRGPNTEGIDRAADYIAKRMAKIGLKTDTFNRSPYQDFNARVMNFEEDSCINYVWPNMWSFIGIGLYDLFLKNDDSPATNETPDRSPKTRGGFVKLNNVVAILDTRGPLAEETIVVGAHYDHLGERKNPDGKVIAVYHGANDNASGVAVMLEVAQMLAQRQKKLPRRILFVAFSGEELGLLGSFHYVNHPPVPLEKTIAMINLDVVGRMEGDMVISIGASTSPILAKMTDKAVKQRQLTLLEIPGTLAGSDHVAFYSSRIPVVFLLTEGGRSDHHRPTDRANTLNYTGMRKIAQIAADISVELAEAEQRPEFSEEGAISIFFRNILRLWGRMTDN